MNGGNEVKLNVLLVEDDDEFLTQLCRDLPTIFTEFGVQVSIVSENSFEEGIRKIQDPHTRFDLVISDTYRGELKSKDAAVLHTVKEYRSGKFCPIIVFSSGPCPADLNISEFVRWADKAKPDHLENEIRSVLELGIPQLARRIHTEVDKAAGEYLWEFLEGTLNQISNVEPIDKNILDRLIRRRAALSLSDLSPGGYSAVENKLGLEYYVYPALDQTYHSLGDIIRHKETGEFHVVLTPHCHLYIQPHKDTPRADFVLIVKTVTMESVLGKELLTKTAGIQDNAKQEKKLAEFAQSPAKIGKNIDGRYWYLPGLLEIPELYCDFLQLESLPYVSIVQKYQRIATLLPPYAEAMQSCFSTLFSSVGIPNIDPASMKKILPTTS